MSTPHRFVLLEHNWDGVHYDLMLERDGVLKTWRLPSPLLAGSQHVTALPNHRLAYLDYEGPLTNNRGSVKRLASGAFVIHTEEEATCRLTLHSDTLTGELTLQRVNDSTSDWTLHFDPFSRDTPAERSPR